MVDVSKIKVGDEVTILAKIVDVSIGAPFPVICAISAYPGEVRKFGMGWEAIATHTPAPRSFAFGDKVTWGGGDFTGEIKCIDGEDAWIKTDHGRCTIHVSNLRHADAPADEIVVTEDEASRAFDFFYDSESGACEGAMQKTLVDFLKRRKGAGR